MFKNDLPIVTPCSMTWDDLEITDGPKNCRHCRGCEKSVHNLSQMTRHDAKALVDQSEDLCVIYDHTPSGRVSFKRPRWVTKLFGLLAFIVPMTPMITACGGLPRRDLESLQPYMPVENAIDVARYDAAIAITIARTVSAETVDPPDDSTLDAESE